MTDNQIRALALAAAQEQTAKAVTAQKAGVQTTDATAAAIAAVTPDPSSTGVIEYTVLGMTADGLSAVTVKRAFRYKHDGTTLAIGSEADQLALATDVTGATVAAAINSGTIEIRVTGAASTTIDWLIRWEVLSLVQIVLL